MADALCGPSNPLQQFKQQTQFDRTLQQDRLTSRHAPAQGFRSHDPNVGVLDPEFEAFQAGVPLPDLPQFQQRPPSFVGPSHTPSWANDFQRMQISPSPAFQQQHVARPASANANWAQGFREHVAQTAPRAQTAAQSPQAFQQMARYGMNGFQSNFAQPNYMPNVTSKGKEPATEQYDEAAFAAAFDQASQDLLAEGPDQMEVEQPAYEAGASTADFDIDQETHVDKARRAAMEALRPHQRRLSQDLEAQRRESISQELKNFERLQDEPLVEEVVIQEDAEQIEQHQQDDDDALAATAKELLEKVEHNKTDKFKNSQFLNLMRKLRDREMKVEGDQMIETVRADLKSPISSHDSTYGSGISTPISLSHNSSYPPLVASKSRVDAAFDQEHQFDHWESPYR